MGLKVEEIESVSGGMKGAWDYAKLAEDLSEAVKTPGAKQILVDEIMKYHSTGEIKHKTHYAKKAIQEACAINGWEVVKIASARSGDKQYIQFEVKF